MDFPRYIEDSAKGTKENPSPDQDTEEEEVVSPESQDLFSRLEPDQTPKEQIALRRTQPDSPGQRASASKYDVLYYN